MGGLDKEKEKARSNEKAVMDQLGVSPSQLAGATFIGMPHLLSPLTEGIPAALSKALRDGRPIPESRAGLPVSLISEFTREEAKAIRDFAKAQGVKVPIVGGLAGQGVDYFMDDHEPLGERAKKTLKGVARGLGLSEEDGRPRRAKRAPAHIGLTTTGLPTAFHEIGHASPVGGSHAARRALQDAAHLSKGAPGTIARGLIASNVLVPPDEDASISRKALYEGAPALVAATHLPELAEEGRASYHALRGARRHGVGTLRAIKDLAPAFATYLGPAAGAAFATEAAKRLVMALSEGAEAKEQIKTSSEVDLPDPSNLRASGALRARMSSAWRVGGSPPKPKSKRPRTSRHPKPTGMPKASPPSNYQYHKDLLSSLYNPQRGFRTAV